MLWVSGYHNYVANSYVYLYRSQFSHVVLQSVTNWINSILLYAYGDFPFLSSRKHYFIYNYGSKLCPHSNKITLITLTKASYNDIYGFVVCC